MIPDDEARDGRDADTTPDRKRSAAARRALAEAAERRATQDHTIRGDEVAGRGGLDPVRYGDWEVKGLASDF